MKSIIKLNGKIIEFSQLLIAEILFHKSDFEKSFLESLQRWKSSDDSFSFFTSGSTGLPKSISFSRNQLKASAHLSIGALRLKPQQTSLICLDTRFIAGKMMVIRSLENSMNIIVVEPSADPLKEISMDEQIDFAAFVPYQLQAILESTLSTAKLNKIKCVIIGGAPIDERTRLKLQALKGNVYATYGMTETITHIALQKLNGVHKQDCFKALKSVSLSVDDRQCLVIEAPHLPEKVITNDVIELIDKDTFRWIGRFDNVINSGGVKVIPENVEAAMLLVFKNLDINNRYFLAGVKDAKLGTKLVLVMEGATQPTETAIIDELKKSLSKYEVPKAIFFVPNFVETQTQKINRTETLKLVEE